MDASSPTVGTESVLLTSVIEAKEHQHVISTAIPGASMQGDQEETVHMQLKGILAERLIKCNPAQYEKYVIYENKQKILYVELMKALYQTLLTGFYPKFKNPSGIVLM